MILLHVAIAIFSILNAGFNLFKPSVFKLRLNYLLVSLTLASGTYLVVHSHSSMMQACTSGLVYLAVVCSGIIPARNKLLKRERAE